MKKHSMWIILGAILVIELIVYMMLVSPTSGEVASKTADLEDDISALKKIEGKGRSVVTQAVLDRHAENTREVEKALEDSLKFYKLADESIKKWFLDLKITDWERQPNPAQFQTFYNDKFDALRAICKEKGITISGKDDVYLVELTNGEKIEGIYRLESDEVLKLEVEGAIRDIPRDAIKSRLQVTKKLTQQEQQIISAYGRLRGALDEDQTEPESTTGGFWQTNKLNAKNIRTAQIQYWIQRMFVDSLMAADGRQVVFVSFYKEAKAKSGRSKKGKEQEKPAENAIEEYFDRVPVTILVKLPYGAVSRLLNSLNNAGINMEFKSFRVMKPLLDQVRTALHKDVKRGIVYTGQMTNRVMPKVMDLLEGVDLGKVPNNRRQALPDQDELIKEPPVLVELAYDIMVMKKTGAAK